MCDHPDIVFCCWMMLGVILQTDTDYWLLSDAGVGISDMWRSDRILFNNASCQFQMFTQPLLSILVRIAVLIPALSCSVFFNVLPLPSILVHLDLSSRQLPMQCGMKS